MPRVLLQEIERKVLRFLTPITWTKLGMFSAVGALYGTQLIFQDLRLSNVACVLSTHEAWIDIRRGTISALGRWRSLGDLLGTLGASQRMGWSHVASNTTTLAKECASTSRMVSAESTPQCCHRFCQTGRSASRR